MITATTAPSRPKISRFTATDVTLSAGALSVSVRVDDANGVSQGSTAIILNNSGLSQVLTYDAAGNVQQSSASMPSAATNAYVVFTGQAGGFGAKIGALETHLVSVGALPS